MINKKLLLLLTITTLSSCSLTNSISSNSSDTDPSNIVDSLSVFESLSIVDSLSSISDVSLDSTANSSVAINNNTNVSTPISDPISISSSISLSGNYYDSISSNLSGSSLKSSLNNLIKKFHYPHGYTSPTSYYDNCDADIANVNEDPNNSNNVIMFYEGISIPKTYIGATASNPDGWNKEHVWAKSHGNFASQGAGADLHHLLPTNNGVNNARSSKDFDEGGSAVTSYNSYGKSYNVVYIDNNDKCYMTSNTFEPRDAVKGDVARIIFYMAVRYEGGDGGPNLEIVDYITGNSSKSATLGKLSTLLKWHLQDPVDAFEMKRNESIYNLQGNRNPFIDCPEYASLIWA